MANNNEETIQAEEQASAHAYPEGTPPPPGGGPLDESGAGDVRQYLSVLMAYWWVILLFILAGTGLGAAYSVFAKPIYRATCRFEVFREPRLDLSEDSRRGGQNNNMEGELGRQVIVLKSGVLRGRVRDSLKPKWEEQISDRFLTPKISVDRLREAQTMVDIQVDAVDAEYAKDYLEEMLDVFQELRREEVLKTTDKALTNLRREQEDISRELEAAQEALAQFEQKHNLKFTRTKAQYDEQFLANLVQRENALKMEQKMLESQVDFLEQADAATIRDALQLTMETHENALDMSNFLSVSRGEGNMGGEEGGDMGGRGQQESAEGMQRLQWGEERDWQQQEAKLLRLKAEYEDKLEVFKASHPEMQEMQDEIKEAQRNLELAGSIALKRLAGRLSAVRVQKNALSDAARAWRRELQLTTEERADHGKLVSKVQHLEELYNEVYKRILDGSVVNVDALFTRLIEPIRSLSEPVWPDKVKVMALAILAAVALGVGTAFVLDFFDTSFLDIMAIEQRLGLPYICGVPNWGRVLKSFKPDSDRILVTRDKSDVATETYRTLRASVEHAIGNRDSYSLMVTSGDEAEGKSVTVLNMAILFAWSGKKVLLVDGDLRRGTCHRPLEIPGTPGFCELLVGEQPDWRSTVSETSYENLSFLPAGKYRHEVPEMLSATKLSQLMQEWRAEYDIVLLDSAPVGRVIDTALLSRFCDGVMLIVRHGEARFANVRHALHRLPDANVVGFCLNGVEMGRRRRGYYGYYGSYYGGRYGYGAQPAYGYGYGYGAAGAPPVPYETPSRPYERPPYEQLHENPREKP